MVGGGVVGLRRGIGIFFGRMVTFYLFLWFGSDNMFMFVSTMVYSWQDVPKNFMLEADEKQQLHSWQLLRLIWHSNNHKFAFPSQTLVKSGKF